MLRLRAVVVALATALPALSSAAPWPVVLLGDSITRGLTSEPAGAPFATLLADALGPGFDVINLGCGGASSRDWSPSVGDSLCGGLPDPELPEDLYPALAEPNLPADLVVVMLGTNDAIGFLEPAPLTQEEYRTAMEELVSALLFDGAGQVLLATPPPNFAVPFANLALEIYAGEILGMCSAPGDAVLCGPDVLHLLDASDFEDGQLHPNASGHAKIAGAMQASILLAIPEPGTGMLLGLGLSLMAQGVCRSAVSRQDQRSRL